MATSFVHPLHSFACPCNPHVLTYAMFTFPRLHKLCNAHLPSGPWGELVPVENINRRWFEREENWKWPQNAHWTQGIWHSARYMGCAESMKKMNNGDTCRIQVCRYARAGNCDMARFESTIGRNWLPPMLEETSRCGPNCPSDFCF